MALYFLFSALVTVGDAADPSTCIPGKGVSCLADAPRGGAAMMQAGAAATLQAAPLKGRLATLTAEVASLEGRITALKTEVGVAAGGAGAGGDAAAPVAEAEALLEMGNLKGNSALFADYAAILHTKSDAGSLKVTVAELESKMATVNSNIQQLRNQVKGLAFSEASLLATDAAKSSSESDGSTLESRTISLEREVADARTQVTSIEQVVVG